MVAVRTILHPTDFSASADEAFCVATALAASLKARVVVLHVSPRQGPMVAYGAARIQFRAEDERNRREAALRALQAPDPSVPVDHRLVEGETVTEILHAAEQFHPEMIVMGTRGRTGLERLALGSVADRVLRQAPCPVLTVNTATTPHAAVRAGRVRSA